MDWVCIECGARQAEAGRCKACGKDDVLDSRVEKTRELMYDVDLRLGMARETRFRFIGVGIGMAVVFLLWTVPGYWAWEQMVALPFLADQWLMMAAIGFGVMMGLKKMFDKKRFPYLTDDQKILP